MLHIFTHLLRIKVFFESCTASLTDQKIHIVSMFPQVPEEELLIPRHDKTNEFKQEHIQELSPKMLLQMKCRQKAN